MVGRDQGGLTSKCPGRGARGPLSVVSRGVPLPSSIEGSSSEPEDRCPAESKSIESRTRSRALVAGDGIPAIPRASSSEVDIFIEGIQSTKA